MPWPVRHKVYLTLVTGTIFSWMQPIHDFAQQADEINISHLIVPAHIVRLPQRPSSHHSPQRSAVIFDMQPVSDVFPFAIHGYRLVAQAL
jgi:hypothetical protein